MTTLVFLENHDGELTKGALGVLGKAASLGGDVAGVVLGSGVRDAAAAAGGFGASTVYWGLEVMSSNTSRPAVIGVNVKGPRTRFVNMVVHDAGDNGFGFWAEAPDAEIYGSIIYNNGRQISTRGAAWPPEVGFVENRFAPVEPWVEHPLPKVKPQADFRSKVFSAYSRWVLGITKRSS